MNAATARLVAIVIAGALIVGVLLLGPAACQKMRSMAAQGRLQHEQAGALANSAADAVATVGRSGEATDASEKLTRSNEKEIRDAQGADAGVDPAVRNAGLDSLCRRTAYRGSEQCRLRKPAPH